MSAYLLLTGVNGTIKTRSDNVRKYGFAKSLPDEVAPCFPMDSGPVSIVRLVFGPIGAT